MFVQISPAVTFVKFIISFYILTRLMHVCPIVIRYVFLMTMLCRYNRIVWIHVSMTVTCM